MQVEQTIDTFRGLLRRWVAPLVAWIPDVTVFPRRRQAAIGVGASILVHLLLLLFFLVVAMVIPEKKERTPLVPPHPLEVQLVPMPEPAQPDPLVPKRRMIDPTNGLTGIPEKPKDADFESDKDTVAGSEQPPNGILPLPSQQGRTDLPVLDFANQDVRIGAAPEPRPDTVRPPDEKAEKNPQPLPPNVSPLYTPQPLTPEAIAAAEKAAPTDQLPDPAKMARATPPPLKLSDKPEKDALAMLAATPPPRPLATPGPEAQVAPNSVPAKPSITDRFQENLRKTATEGNLPKAAKNSINAVNTPMGRWHRRLHQQIESLCALKGRNVVGELGTVLVTIKLRADGTVKSAKVVDDGGSPMHTELILQVIQEMRPEQLPAEAEPLMEDGLLEIPLRFVLY